VCLTESLALLCGVLAISLCGKNGLTTSGMGGGSIFGVVKTGGGGGIFNSKLPLVSGCKELIRIGGGGGGLVLGLLRLRSVYGTYLIICIPLSKPKSGLSSKHFISICLQLSLESLDINGLQEYLNFKYWYVGFFKIFQAVILVL